LNEVPDFFSDPLGIGQKILRWYEKNPRTLPWRELWKKNQDPWQIWVSEIMLQQTVIKAVIPVYQRFLKQYPGVKELAKADEEEIRLAVRGLGYYRRFALLHKAAVHLTQNKLDFPQDFEGWKALPGVGDYTAAAISSICFKYPVAVVDGNVERVLCRLLDWRVAPNDPKLKKYFRILCHHLLPVGAKNHPGNFNQGIMELGQTVCTSSPDCEACPVKDSCHSYRNKSQHLAPAAKIKKANIELDLNITIAARGTKIALYKRPVDAKFLKNTWGFLTEIRQGRNFAFDGGAVMASAKSNVIGKIKHNITNHKLNITVKATKSQGQIELEKKWVATDEVESLLVSNLDRKAWTLMQKNL